MVVRVDSRLIVEQLTGKCCLLPIVDSQVNRFVFMSLPVGQDTVHKIIHPIRTVNPTEQRCPPLLDCVHRSAVSIDGSIHQNACLDISTRLLYQFNLAGQCRNAGVACLFHSGSPDGFGVHVVTKSTQVTVAERLKVDDRRVDVALAGWAYGIARKALFANLGDVGGKLISRNDLCKTEPLYAGKILFCLQAIGVGLPFFALYRD